MDFYGVGLFRINLNNQQTERLTRKLLYVNVLVWFLVTCWKERCYMWYFESRWLLRAPHLHDLISFSFVESNYNIYWNFNNSFTLFWMSLISLFSSLTGIWKECIWWMLEYWEGRKVSEVYIKVEIKIIIKVINISIIKFLLN